jgi:nucleoside-diphosphate-sugar epimerase
MISVLVTGATGFIGSRLVRKLLDGGVPVLAMVREHSTIPPLLQKHGAELQVLQDDGTVEGLANAMTIHRTSLVVHCAAHYVSTHAAKDVVPLIEANVLLGARLAEAMVLAHTTSLIVLSTMWQHAGEHPASYHPANLYAATKRSLEDILLFYSIAAGLRVRVLEICDTYGPEDNRPKVIPAMLKALRDNTALELSPGEQHLDLLHVDDVVAGIMRAADSAASWPPGTFSAFSLCAIQTVSLRELVALLETAARRRIEVRWGAKPYRPREVMRPHSPHPPLPGWSPQIELFDGLASLVKGLQ